MKKNTIISIFALASLLLASCGDSGTDGFPDMTPPPAHTGKYTNPTPGYVTYYDDHMAESTSTALNWNQAGTTVPFLSQNTMTCQPELPLNLRQTARQSILW